MFRETNRDGLGGQPVASLFAVKQDGESKPEQVVVSRIGRVCDSYREWWVGEKTRGTNRTTCVCCGLESRGGV